MQQTITVTEGIPTEVPRPADPVDATEAEGATEADAGKPAGIPADGAMVGGQRPGGFWAEYRARRGERVPRSKLRFAISLAGEGFCRRALASSEPFAKGCAAEAAGTPGGLREALVTLAVAGGRAVAREVARGDVASLEERARGLEVDDARLRSALAIVGKEEAVRILGGRVGFRKAILFEAALRAGDPEQCEARVALAAAGVGRVRSVLRGPRDEPKEVRRGTQLVVSEGETAALSPFGQALAEALARAS